MSLRCVQPDGAPPLPEQLLEALGVSSPTTIPPGFLDDFAAKYADEGLEDVVEQVGTLDGAPLNFNIPRCADLHHFFMMLPALPFQA